jgi:RHS repeat-associated protein
LTLPDGIVVNYGYDQASELTGLTYSLSGNVLGNLTYAYDADGRRVQMGGSWARTGMPNPTTSTAVYNVDNELTNWNGATLAYDANGNMTSDGTNTYTWDARNQLASIAGNFTASFQYDPFGRRLGKTINGSTTNFLYDGMNPVQELAGGSPSANLLTGLGVDEDFQRTDLTGTSNFLSDALGSTLALADPTGTVQTQYTYDPFGGTTTQGAASANSLQFTSRENDGDGLYYSRARYYDPSLMRFISQDPSGLAAGTDRYVYADDAPTALVDPLGLSPMAGRGSCQANCGPNGYRDATPAEEAKELQEAEGFEGTPYKWGGKTPSGFDCSGYVCYVIQHSINPGYAYSPTSGMASNPGLRVLPPGASHVPGDVELFPSHTGFYDPSQANPKQSLLSAEGSRNNPNPGVVRGNPGWFPGARTRRWLRPQVPCSH